MRVWLMYGVYKANPERLLQNMDKFLKIAEISNITVKCACVCACDCLRTSVSFWSQYNTAKYH